MGTPREDVEDELCPVYDLELRYIAKLSYLRGRKLLVEDDHGSVFLEGVYDKLFYLPCAHEVLGVELLGPLAQRVKDGDIVCPGKLFQFFKGLHLRVLVPRGDAHEYGAFLRAAYVPCDCSTHLLFERGGEVVHLDIKVVERYGGLYFISPAFRVEGQEVRGVYVSWKAVVLDSYGCHVVEPEEREVCEVVLGERFVLEVGVHAPHPAQVLSAKRVVGKDGYDDLSFAADDDRDYRALAVYYDPELFFQLP